MEANSSLSSPCEDSMSSSSSDTAVDSSGKCESFVEQDVMGSVETEPRKSSTIAADEEVTGLKEPRSARSSSAFFYKEWRAVVRQERPKASSAEIARILGAKWRLLSAEERKPYREKAIDDKIRFERQMKEHLRLKKEIIPSENGESARTQRPQRQTTRRPSAAAAAEYIRATATDELSHVDASDRDNFNPHRNLSIGTRPRKGSVPNIGLKNRKSSVRKRRKSTDVASLAPVCTSTCGRRSKEYLVYDQTTASTNTSLSQLVSGSVPMLSLPPNLHHHYSMGFASPSRDMSFDQSLQLILKNNESPSSSQSASSRHNEDVGEPIQIVGDLKTYTTFVSNREIPRWSQHQEMPMYQSKPVPFANSDGWDFKYYNNPDFAAGYRPFSKGECFRLQHNDLLRPYSDCAPLEVPQRHILPKTPTINSPPPTVQHSRYPHTAQLSLPVYSRAPAHNHSRRSSADIPELRVPRGPSQPISDGQAQSAYMGVLPRRSTPLPNPVQIPNQYASMAQPSCVPLQSGVVSDNPPTTGNFLPHTSMVPEYIIEDEEACPMLMKEVSEYPLSYTYYQDPYVHTKQELDVKDNCEVQIASGQQSMPFGVDQQKSFLNSVQDDRLGEFERAISPFPLDEERVEYNQVSTAAFEIDNSYQDIAEDLPLGSFQQDSFMGQTASSGLWEDPPMKIHTREDFERDMLSLSTAALARPESNDYCSVFGQIDSSFSDPFEDDLDLLRSSNDFDLSVMDVQTLFTTAQIGDMAPSA